MSFNRLSYDSCAYSKTLQESTDPLEYSLYRGKYESCTNCPDNTNNLEFGIRSDLESDLKGQVRIGSKCPGEKFPLHKVDAAPFTPSINCQSIYQLTPVNTGYPSANPVPLVKPTTNGLKDLSAYGQNMCPVPSSSS